MYKLASVKLWVTVASVALITLVFFFGLGEPTDNMWAAYLAFVGGSLGVYTTGNVAAKRHRPTPPEA